MNRLMMVVAVLASIVFCQSAQAGIMFVDPVPSGCQGISIDPANPCYSSKGYPGCNKDYKTYEGCLSYCTCGFKYNYDKCKGGRLCIEVAKTEKKACDTQCMIDFV